MYRPIFSSMYQIRKKKVSELPRTTQRWCSNCFLKSEKLLNSNYRGIINKENGVSVQHQHSHEIEAAAKKNINMKNLTAIVELWLFMKGN